jgi:F-type H+-transporting ATPase subunit gamma
MLKKSGNIIHPYLTAGESERKAVIVITSNRGLAGGYNSNVVKLITNSEFKKEDLDIYALGSKGYDALARRGYNIKENRSDIMDDPTYEDAMKLCKVVLDSYANGEIGEIYLAYTHFKNTVTHIPTLIKLLPVDTEGFEEAEVDDNVMMNFEPNTEEALDLVIPKYVTSLFYGALVESVASENGARMQAMDSATSNADEIISDLTLKFNRARHGAITQELTEIIAGANAIN